MLNRVFCRGAASEKASVVVVGSLLPTSAGIPPVPYCAEYSCLYPRWGIAGQFLEEPPSPPGLGVSDTGNARRDPLRKASGARAGQKALAVPQGVDLVVVALAAVGQKTLAVPR